MNIHIAKIHKSLKCDTCLLSFLSSLLLKKHNEKIHEGNQLENCTICEGKFNSKKNLRKHLTVFHEKKEHYDYSCPICSKPCSVKNMLRKHVAKVHNDQGLIPEKGTSFCMLCDKQVIWRDHVTEFHNSKDGKLNCPKCEKILRNYHTGWLAFVCFDAGIFGPVHLFNLFGW